MSSFRPHFILHSAFCILISLSGCRDSGDTSEAPPNAAAVEAQRREVSRRLFDSAVDMLNQLDSYDESRVDSAVEQVVRRLNESLDAGVLDNEKTEPFTVDDGRILREIVWLREAAEHAVGEATDPLVRAEKLLDWTVRNVQLIDDAAPSAGTVDERLPY